MNSMLAEVSSQCDWFRAGSEVFPGMLAAIDQAQRSVCLETYAFSGGGLGESFRQALVRARRRGARVRVLLDAFGSRGLPWSFWNPLTEIGGEARWFNPLFLHRFGIRDHRKLLVCDERVAFIGGFNIMPHYEGDGIKSGWFDIGLRVRGPLASDLAASFDEMFARADLKHKRFARLRKSSAKKTVSARNELLLFSGPGRGRSPIKGSLRRDLALGKDVRVMVAYFLPTWRLRRDLVRVSRRGGSLSMILAGRSDVVVSQLAGQSLYRRFLRARADVYEYQPQILHAKLIVIDDIVYVGSANLDQRSLNINYELMVRFENKELAAQARHLFAGALKHCRQISLEEWRKSRTFWTRLKQRWAYFLLVRIDPYLALRQWRGLPD